MRVLVFNKRRANKRYCHHDNQPDEVVINLIAEGMSMFILAHWGALIIGVGLVELGYLVARDKIKAWNILAFGILVIMGGVTVANLTNITDILLTLGGGSLHLQRVQEDVDTRANEIKAIQQNIQSLADEVSANQKSVSSMRNEIKRAFSQMLDIFFYEFATRNMSPVPKLITDEEAKRFNNLAHFAYPDQAAADAALRALVGNLNKAFA